MANLVHHSRLDIFGPRNPGVCIGWPLLFPLSLRAERQPGSRDVECFLIAACIRHTIAVRDLQQLPSSLARSISAHPDRGLGARGHLSALPILVHLALRQLRGFQTQF